MGWLQCCNMHFPPSVRENQKFSFQFKKWAPFYWDTTPACIDLFGMFYNKDGVAPCRTNIFLQQLHEIHPVLNNVNLKTLPKLKLECIPRLVTSFKGTTRLSFMSRFISNTARPWRRCSETLRCQLCVPGVSLFPAGVTCQSSAQQSKMMKHDSSPIVIQRRRPTRSVGWWSSPADVLMFCFFSPLTCLLMI